MEESNIVKHAREELDLLLKHCEDEEAYKMQQAINENILNVVKVFAEGNYSGFTASYAIPIIEKLLRQSFITPLTGEDGEWSYVSEGLYQNKRESAIFKNENGEAYYLNGKAFSDDGGKTWYTNDKSSVPVTFPLKELPETEYVLVEESD